MPIRCCVPNCSSKYKQHKDNARFHKFPREKNAFRIWCVRLRLCADVVNTKVHYVCSKHFKSTDYVDSFGGLRQILLLDTLPSQNLPQTSSTKLNPKVQLKHEARLRKSYRAKDMLTQNTNAKTFNQDLQHNSDEQADEPYAMLTELQIEPVLSTSPTSTTDYVDSFGGLRQRILQNKILSQNLHHATRNPEVQLKHGAKLLNTEKAKDMIIPSPSGISNQGLQDNSDEQADESNTMNTQSQPEPLPSTNTISTQTENLIRTQESIYFSALSGSDFMYYTGLDSTRFLFLFDMLNIKTTPYDKYMSQKDQLILTLIKYRQNLQFQLIGKLYGVTRFIVRNIFVYFTNCLYNHLKNVDFWSLRYKNPNAYTAIINCSELVTNQSCKNPELSEICFSQYKNRFTLKYLVAIDEKGILVYCSDVFGGSMSDAKVFNESGLLQKLKSGDILLSDRGFHISGVLAEHGVALNIPPGKGELTPIEHQETRVNALRRIHVKRITRLAKNNKILSDTFPAALLPIANKIIYVANMISNYKPIIV